MLHLSLFKLAGKAACVSSMSCLFWFWIFTVLAVPFSNQAFHVYSILLDFFLHLQVKLIITLSFVH